MYDAGQMVVGQFDKGFIADAMNVCLKACNSQANCQTLIRGSGQFSQTEPLPDKSGP